MDDLQEMVDAMHLTERMDERQVNQLADAIETRLKLPLGKSQYCDLAKRLHQMSLEKRQNGGTPPSSNGSPHKGMDQNGSMASSSSNRNENSHSNLSSPTPPASSFSPNITHRRGRSPARSAVSSNGPRSSSTNSAAYRKQSPVRGGYFSNKIPPAGKVAQQEPAAPKRQQPRQRSGSPAFRKFFQRGTKANAEEKKDQSADSETGAPSRADMSPGASPQKPRSSPSLGRQGAHSDQAPQQSFQPQVFQQPSSPTRIQSRPSTPVQAERPPQKPRSSPSLGRQGGYLDQAPQQPFQPQVFQQPSSPTRIQSRPSTPVQAERPPSRSASPYSARPGLQEPEDEEEDCLSLSGRSQHGRSPARSFPPVTSIPSSSSSVSGGFPNMSGMTSHPKGGHRRTRSTGVDDDSTFQPPLRRGYSRSPMRRSQDDDDDSVQQPAPPRSFSKSPSVSRGTFPIPSGESIHVPDLSHVAGLSMPDFFPGETSSIDGDAMFTPPPRAMPAPRPHDEESYQETSSLPGFRLQEGDCFRVCLPEKNNRARRNNSRRNIRMTAPAPAGASPGGVPPASHSPPYAREEIFSPMDVDVDEPSPTPPTFAMGVSNPLRMRMPRRKIPDPPSGSAENSFSQEFPSAAAAAGAKEAANPNVDFSGKAGLIGAKREEAKGFYMKGDYRGSIMAYTEAIKIHGQASSGLPGDTRAVLLSNRAAGLLMVGAYEAAVSDCQLALQHVTPPRGYEAFSNDSGPLLAVKLHTRMARAYLKLGDHRKSKASFEEAITTANEAAKFSKENHVPQMYQQNQDTLSQMVADATLDQSDAKRLADACDKLKKCTMLSMKFPGERSRYSEALGHVNVALSIASGSVALSESKLTILGSLKRWREVVGFCERLAAFNVRQDSLFVDDLESRNPFPGVPPASALKAGFFGDARDEDASTRELKLTSRAVAEAVVRLPYVLAGIYLRALRLEERYPAADMALRSLEDLMKRGTGVHDYQTLQSKFSWLPKERSKLNRTKAGRERGDELFRNADFDLAAAQYTNCLNIDGEGLPEPFDEKNAGGRLHAVLHCNRAACMMALRRFHGAIEECTAALKIHPRYMKAILRRARCYTRLQRTQEAIAEYKRWLDLVEDAKKSSAARTISPCLFDGPSDVKPAEISQIQKELEELHKTKRRAEANAREEAGRRTARERERFQDNYSSSWRSGPGVNAQDRRDQWYNQQSGPRRWDSFTDRGPRSHSQPRSQSWSNRQQRSSSQGRARPDPLVSPRSSTADHYSVLGVPQNASADDIKRAYRRLALKYHPDKNKEKGAADNFRRVQLANEVLKDENKRRQYDSELRAPRRFY